jgi:hypothetical protein
VDSVFRLILTTAGSASVVNALGTVQGALGGLTSIATSVISSMAGVKASLNLGAELEGLSRRSGQSVADLVVLQRAFENASMSPDRLALMIDKFHKSLDTAITKPHIASLSSVRNQLMGLEEDGYAAGDAFSRLGLSAQALMGLPFREQIEALARAFERIPTAEERSGLAMKLFGRAGGEMLQLIGKPELLVRSQEEAGRLADRLQDDASRFEDIGHRLTIVKLRMQEMWVVAAEQLLPALQSTATWLSKLNLAPAGAMLAGIPAIALAAGGLYSVRKLDDIIATSTLKMRAGMMQEVGFGLSNVTGALAKVLPIGLAAIVAIEVAKGIYGGWVESRNQILAAANAGFDQLGKLQARVAGIRTEGDKTGVIPDLEKYRAQTAAKLTEEQKRWFPSQGAISSYVEQLREVDGLMRLLSSARADAIAMTNQQSDEEKALATWRESAEAKRLREIIAVDTIARRDAEEALASQKAALAVADRNAATYAHIRSIRQLSGKPEGAPAASEEEKELRNAAQRAEILKDIATLEQKVARIRTDAAKNSLEEELARLAWENARIEGDFARTDAEKWNERKANLGAQISAQQRYLDTMREARKSASTEESRASYDSSIRSGIGTLGGLQQQQAQLGPDPNSWIQQMQAGLAQLRADWGTTAQGIASTITGTIGSAVNSISSGISGWILRTTSWRQALANAGSTILTTLVQSIVQLGVRWVASQIMMAVAGKTIAAASAATLIPIAMAQSLIWAAPATLATIASFGGAAAQAPFSIAGAMAMTQAMAAIPGFAEGGYTGDEGGVVHRREFVFSAPAVESIGLGNLRALHAAARGPAPVAGGSAGARQSEPQHLSLAILDTTTAVEDFLNSSKGRKMFYDRARRVVKDLS